MQALPSYGERVSALQDNLTALQQRLGGIEGAFGPIGQRLGGIEQAVARPADGSVTERLAAIEGMLGPLSQRLGQALAEQSASLQALHGRVESVASGTQAALATPIQIDEAAVGALEPRLAALLSEVTALRQEVSSLKASAPAVDLSALQAQIAELAAASNASTGEAGGPAFGGDVDAALRSVEQRITEHVDDAILALAQTLLGRGQRVSAAVDLPLGAELVATGWPPAEEDEFDDEEASDFDDDADAEYAEEEAEEVEVAQIDFSAPELAEEAAAASDWTAPVPSYAEDPDQGARDAAYLAQTGDDAPFDQDAQWAAQPHGGDVHPDVVPARRRRWFR
jgi:hypothetical protein